MCFFTQVDQYKGGPIYRRIITLMTGMDFYSSGLIRKTAYLHDFTLNRKVSSSLPSITVLDIQVSSFCTFPCNKIIY